MAAMDVKLLQMPDGLYVNVEDLLVYLDKSATALADNPDLDPMRPSAVIASLAQEISEKFGLTTS